MRCVIRTAVVGCLLLSFLQCQHKDPPSSGVATLAPPKVELGAGTPPRVESALGPRLRLAPPGPNVASAPLVHAAPGSLLVAAPRLGPPGSAEAAAAPLSLTASDGTGLTLVRLAASAVVQGPLAFTELHLSFQNPEPRQLEGRFSIVLPKGAAISRFAMLLPSGWQEAEVVERQAARRAYEDFLHRRQDPALLEHEAGNQFSARVFPIPPSGVKELKISYSQELVAADDLYRLPLVGLPQMAELAITAIAGDQITQVVKRDFRPEHDFLIRPPGNAAGRAPGLLSDELLVARVQLGGPAGQGPEPALARIPSLLVLFDTSASRAPGFAARVRELGELLGGLGRAQGGALPIQVVCFDQAVESIYQGAIAGFGEAEQGRILRRGPLGASNLQAALGFAKGQKGAARLLVLTDGVVTAGASDKELVDAVSQLKEAAVQRLDIVLSGGIRDEAAMARLVSGHLPSDGLVIDGAKGSEAVVRRLQRATLSGVQVAVAGARWVWPARLDGVQPGDDFLVYAEFPTPAETPTQVATVTLSGPLNEQKSVPLRPVSRPLLERALVQAYLTSLGQALGGLSAQASSAAATAALQKDIVALSRRFRVLSDYTALLVLETEDDYARFGIDRKSLADILTVGARGIELTQRSAPVVYAQSGLLKTKPEEKVEPESPTKPPDAPASGAVAPDEAAAPSRGTADGAARSGVLGVLRAGEQDPRALASVFGRNSALGREADAPMGGLVGTEVGDAYGAGGLGLSGRGSGGGTGEGTRGLGNLGTIGRGVGGSGSYGTRVGNLRGRSSAAPEVVPGTAEVRGSLDRELIRRIIRRHLNEVKFCYERELVRNDSLRGRVTVQFTIGSDGAVQASIIQSSTLSNSAVEQCIAGAVRRWEFPRPQGGIVLVSFPFVLTTIGDVEQQDPSARWRQPEVSSALGWQQGTTPAYSGKLAEVMDLLKQGQVGPALALAGKWHGDDPGDILALVALGESLEAQGDVKQAARAYGSIIDLYPSRADMRRFAGERLERLGSDALALAADTFAQALVQRPDHPASHRLRAYVLLRQGDAEAAFAGLELGATRQYPENRFAGVPRILHEDLGLVGAAWLRQAPARRKEIEARLAKLGLHPETEPSLRFVLTWETDANDVDFHIHDGRGGHAFYANPVLPSGGSLYADVTTGYGPECFNIPGKAIAFPYKLEAHYYSRGPMGYGMGKLEIIQHDGHGNLKFVERTFVVMNDQAYVDLGVIKAPL